jgi:hypothetical protein
MSTISSENYAFLEGVTCPTKMVSNFYEAQLDFLVSQGIDFK